MNPQNILNILIKLIGLTVCYNVFKNPQNNEDQNNDK